MKKLAILTLLSVAVLAGCQDDDSSSAKERRAQEQMSLQAVEAVGMPVSYTHLTLPTKRIV